MPSDFGNLIFYLILIPAGGVEIYIRFGPVKRREILSWLNWTLALGSAFAAQPSELGLLQSGLTGLATGALVYPIVRLAIHLRFSVRYLYGADDARKQALIEKQRSYHPPPADFGGPPPTKPTPKANTPKPLSAEPPLEPSPPLIGIRLHEVTSELRPGWARRLEFATVVIVMVVGAGLTLWIMTLDFGRRRHYEVDAAAAQEALLATLELSGHDIPRVQRISVAAPCPFGQIGYRWTALDGRGRACIDIDLRVNVTVDEQWPDRR